MSLFGYDPDMGGEIRRQLEGENPAMVEFVVHWAQDHRPGWFHGTESIWDDPSTLHTVEDMWRAMQAAATHGTTDPDTKPGTAPPPPPPKSKTNPWIIVAWVAGGITLTVGLVVLIRKLTRKK